MANIKISQMTAATELDGSELIPIVKGGLNKKITSKLLDLFHNVKHYGAVGDGTTDDTAAIQSAIDAVMADGGGILFFPVGHYVCLSQLVITNDVVSPYGSRPISFLGQGADAFSGEVSTRDPEGGTILDLRSSTAPACIDFRGSGRANASGICFWQNGAVAHTNPYIHTTNTILHISQNSFFGHKTKATWDCSQDAIVFGGTDTTIDNSIDSPFQGYGSVIERNHFQRIRRCVYLRTFANANVIRDNNVWHLCGSSDADSMAAFETEGILASYCAGNIIQNNLIECSGYQYAIRLRAYTLGTTISGNSVFDYGAKYLAGVKIDSTSINNIVIAGYGATDKPYLDDDSGNNMYLHSNGNGNDPCVISQSVNFISAVENQMNILRLKESLRIQRTGTVTESSAYIDMKRSLDESANPGALIFQLLQKGILTIGGEYAGSIYFKDQAGNDTWQFQLGKKWTAVGGGAGMEINSGTNGSYLDLKNYAVRFYDHNGGPLRATIGGGVDGIKLGTGTDTILQKQAAGIFQITLPPTYADDAAAGAGGITQGGIYKTATGVLMVKL
jgi:hypothetical protein